MILLSGFLDVLFRALIFIGLALSVGGIVFYYIVLRPIRVRGEIASDASRRSARLITIGAFLVAISQISAVLVAASSLVDDSGNWHIGVFLTTSFAHAALLRFTLAIVFGAVALALRNRPISQAMWGLTALMGALVMISSAWLTHGASRLENAAALMSVTIIHELAAATWVGGLIHLTTQWRFLSQSLEGKRVWQRVLTRFSPMAFGSALVIVSAGLYLYWEYIRTLAGLVGTAYGVMLISKLSLMAVMLLLGGINAGTIRRWQTTGEHRELVRRLPVFAQIEVGVGVIVLLVSASLTSQPPAIDLVSQQATIAEVLNTFAPKMPQLIPPPHAAMLSSSGSSLDIYWLPTRLERIQSDLNHNISGIFVVVIGLAALLNRVTKAKWTRHWPLLFLPFAAFLLTVAEPNGWPLGKEGFFETLVSPETLTHRLATLIVVVLGIIQWRVQTTPLGETRWRYAFPLLYGIGGALLLTHSHSVFAVKWAFLIEISHNAIGVLAIIAAAASWLELKLPGKREAHVAGIIWPVCFVLIGFVLLFYREI